MFEMYRYGSKQDSFGFSARRSATDEDRGLSFRVQCLDRGYDIQALDRLKPASNIHYDVVSQYKKCISYEWAEKVYVRTRFEKSVFFVEWLSPLLPVFLSGTDTHACSQDVHE
jgi:hypothetical protein